MWFLADLVMRFTVENATTVHVNLHLIRADSADEAYEKALALGEAGDDEYTNPDGKRVRAKFLGVACLNLIHEPLDDGSELAFTERTDLDDAAIARLIPPREKLAAYAIEIPKVPSPRLLTINHAQIMIAPSEQEVVRKFYVELLGFSEIPKPEALRARGGFWLAAGDKQLHVGVDAAGSPKGRAHVAWQVRGLEKFRARLIDAGVAILDGEPVPGYRRFELRDPAGNRVELIEATGVA